MRAPRGRTASRERGSEVGRLTQPSTVIAAGQCVRATVDEVENGGVIDFADDEQMSRRQALADEFYDALGLIDDENRPFFVSDEAALYDVQMEDDDFVVVAVQRHYGITLRVPEDFKRPFWELLDDLRERRVGNEPSSTDL
jgi:hypothetical protein